MSTDSKRHKLPDSEGRQQPAREEVPVKDPVSGRSASDEPPAPPPPRADVLAEEYRGTYLWAQLDKARARIAESDDWTYEEVLKEKPNQPLLNAARRLVKATDNAERNYALADLVVALEDGGQDGLGQVDLHSVDDRGVLGRSADRALPDLKEQLEATQGKLTSLYAGYEVKCERWSLGTCDVYPDGKLCRICQFFTDLGYESFEVTTGGLRSWRPMKELDESVLVASSPASEPEAS